VSPEALQASKLSLLCCYILARGEASYRIRATFGQVTAVNRAKRVVLG
jgi:hypothetical protein